MPIAPVDANALTTPNGSLAGVTAASISNNTFETGLDYLGKVLADVKLKYPTLTKVDVIAHGAGGLIARSYIQSAAYGQSGLPRIDDLSLVGVPNEGVTDPFNLSGDDWSNKAAARMTSQMVDRAFDLMNAGTGTAIVGPTGNILKSENLTPQQFTQRYIASLRHLLPTYDAVDTNNDGVFEKFSTTNPAGNSRVNDLLTDLNAGSKNAWLDLVLGKTNVVYSTEVTTPDQLISRIGPSPAGYQNDEILSFQNFIGRRPNAGESWFEDKVSGHGGDGTVATFSIDPFLGDRRIGSKLILSQLGSLDAAADDVSNRSAFNKEIPGIGQSLNGLINEPGSGTTKRWGDLVKFEKAARDYFDSFNPASQVFNPSNIGQRPTALGLRNAITARIDAVTRDILGGVGISLKGGLDLATNKLQFDLAVNGTYTRSVDLKVDTLGSSQLTSIGVVLSAEAKVNVATTIDIGVSFGVGLSTISGLAPFFNPIQREPIWFQPASGGFTTKCHDLRCGHL